MTQFRFISCICAIALLIALLITPVSRAQDNFAKLQTRVINKIERLNRIVQSSKPRKIDTRRAEVTIEVASRFINFSNWDHQHKAELAAVIGQWEPVAANAQQIADELAVKELNECIKILDRSISQLLARQSNTDDPRADFVIDMNNVVPLGGNYFQGDRPVFPHSILWAPETLPNCFGQFSLGYMHPDYLNETGDPINSGQKDWFAGQLNHVSENGRKAYLFLGHVAPAWARNAENTTGSTTFVDYNIDHPDVKTWWRNLLEGLGPVFFDHPAALQNTMLANEPHWFSSENRWGYSAVSDVTNEQFRNWLINRHSSLDTINQKWNTTFQSIDQIKIVTPIDPLEIGGGMYYDWCQFNMHRATTFFHLLNSEVHRIEPSSLNHVKVPSQLFLDTGHDHGIDWTRLANEFSMLGIDSTVTHNGGISRFAESPRQAMYSIDWTASLAALDFLKSVSPNKIVFDSEWHAVSNIHWRDPNLSHNYVRSTLWLHHLSGLGMNQSWYWGRQQDGTPIAGNQNEFYASFATQPEALNAYLQTMIELNDHAPSIVDVVNSNRPVALLYCEDSAIQDPSYLENFGKVYQALRFTGLRINIKPIELITRQRQQLDDNGQSDHFEVLVIPPTPVCSDKNLTRLRLGVTRSIDLILVGSNNFRLDPYGNEHPANSRQFLNRATTFPDNSAVELHDDFSSAFGDLIAQRPIWIIDSGKPPWGLLQYHSTDGMSVLTNVLRTPITISASGETLNVAPMETRVILPE